ncbi:MAG: hypothetical protein HY536_01755, partial [Candidatus Colwellbacteria bacterium]|nr:hypothetical protein [Candidatus Colwellbacteria bacterium]
MPLWVGGVVGVVFLGAGVIVSPGARQAGLPYIPLGPTGGEELIYGARPAFSDRNFFNESR